MDDDLHAKLKRIENRYAVILLALVPVAQTVLNDLAITFGLAVGGGLELLGFYLLRRFVEKVLDTTRKDKALLIAAACVGKLALLVAGVVLALTLLPVNVFAVIAGVALILVSIAIEALLPESRSGA